MGGPGTRRDVLTRLGLEQLRRRQTVGIVLIAAAILAFALWRADWRGIFPPGWWRW